MRRTLKKAVAFALVCAMTLPSALVASAAPTLNGAPGASTSGNNVEVSGNAVVDTTTYHVVLPADLNFAVDQYEVAGNGQIYGVDYPIMNASEMPVKVTLSVSNNSVADVQLVGSDTDEAILSENENHAAYIAIRVPKSIQVGAGVSAGSISGDTISGNYTDSDTTFAVSQNGTTDLAFLLNKYDTVNAPALSTNNCATFTWAGKVNFATQWQDSDLSVKATFNMKALGLDAMAQITADADNNLISGGGGAGTVTARTFDRTSPNDFTYIVNVPTGATGVSSVIIDNSGSYNPTYYQASIANGILTLKFLKNCPALSNNAVLALGNHTLTVSYDGASGTSPLSLTIR